MAITVELWVGLISILLTVFGISLGFFVVYTYMNFKGLAKRQAEETASEIARKITEEKVNLYLQENIADIVKEYMETFDIQEDIANRVVRQKNQTEENGGKTA